MSEPYMAIRDNPPRIQYVADGIRTKFETPFPIFKTTAIQIFFNDQEVYQDDYDVILDMQSHSTIIFNAPPDANTVITIVRNLSVERVSCFQEGGSLRADVLNYEFDYQIACLQQLADNLNRSMVMPPYAVDTNTKLTLPSPKAGKSIMWSEDGKTLVNSEVEINDIVQTLDERTETAKTASETATQKAEEATKQAAIATQKAEEATKTLDNKASVNADNFSDRGKKNICTFNRQFINKNVLIVSGKETIAGEYTITDLPDDDVIRLAKFQCYLVLSGNGVSSMSIGTDISDTSLVCTTNNGYMTSSTIILPIKRKVKIEFPSTGGGISNGTSLIFLGYM